MRHSSRWIALLLSVVSAACGESPTEPPPPEQIRVLRFWQHNTYRLAVGYIEGAWDYRLGGEVFDQVVYGGMILHHPGGTLSREGRSSPTRPDTPTGSRRRRRLPS
jgi:hypothetical protein